MVRTLGQHLNTHLAVYSYSALNFVSFVFRFNFAILADKILQFCAQITVYFLKVLLVLLLWVFILCELSCDEPLFHLSLIWCQF